MNISRRSFLKLAALSTAAVAVSASMTGCSGTSFFNPNVSVVLQEKATADGKYAFTGEARNLINTTEHKIWEKGSKVASSENVSLTNRDNKTEKMTADNAKKLVEDTLKKDYNMTGKTVTLDTSNSFEFKAQDPSHYVLTITFTVA
jgi:hypothetical protein